MVCEHIIEELTVDDQDVIEIVQVVQVLSHQVTQFPPIPMPVREMFLSAQGPRFGAFSLNLHSHPHLGKLVNQVSWCSYCAPP